jgi:tetratricopeptide (TPR) repeat protein
MKIRPSTLTSADVRRVIQDARDAELCRDLDLFREILSSFWDDIEVDPDLSDFALPVSAEFLRLCGVFLSQFGNARGLNAYQLRAKDILTRAVELFETQMSAEKAAETKVGLATCYWYSGEVQEHDAILRSVEGEFKAQPENKISVKIKLNRLLIATWIQNWKDAESLIIELSAVISSCRDLRLAIQFHNLAGIFYYDRGDVEKNIFHMNEAVSIARKANSYLFVALNLNNLAMTYRATGQFELAHQTIEDAMRMMKSRLAMGWIPHALDTKTLIFLDEGRPDEALKAIRQAIEIFSEGEDYGGLTDAMWTKCLCLLRLKRYTDALAVFIELGDIAARQIGQVAVDKFTTLLMEQIYILNQFPLTDELAALKRSLVVKAVRQTEGHMAKASKVLGLRSQQHLSQILNREFPDIYDELGIKRRARRSNPTKKAPPLDLSRLIMPKGRTYSFNFAWRGTLEPQFFYFPKYLMRPFGIKADAIVAVMPVKSESLFDGGIVLYSYNYTYRIGRLAHDELTQLFLVDLEELIFLSDVNLIGVPIGYCSLADRDKRTMKFERLRLVKKG